MVMEKSGNFRKTHGIMTKIGRGHGEGIEYDKLSTFFQIDSFLRLGHRNEVKNREKSKPTDTFGLIIL